jgi:hypothetical protein
MQRLILSLVLGLLAGPHLALAQANLVQNPGFEAAGGSPGKLTGGWWFYEAKGNPELQLEHGTAHHGTASVRVHATNDTKCTVVSAPFPVAPGDTLQLEAWVRAEQLPSPPAQTYAGIAFRHADGSVFGRAYFPSGALGATWSRVSGIAEAPVGAVSAEVHLGYTNAPGIIWFDDVSAVITNPVSLALVEGAKPWPGAQEVVVKVTNRQGHRFEGNIRPQLGKPGQTVGVSVAPGASQLIKVPVTLTGIGAHNYKLSLLDAAGTPVRVLEGKFRTDPALVLYPACPCYLPTGTGSAPARIDARVNLAPAQRTGLRLTIELADSTGKQVQTATTDASKGDVTGTSIEVPVQQPAVFTVTAHLLDHAGKELAQANTELHVAPAEQAHVQVGSDGFLRVAGKPQFTVGLYSSGRYEEMGKAGFHGTHNYEITTGEAEALINPNDAQVQRLLDKSWTNGLRMMVELPRKAIEKAQWGQVRRRIETFRHHPGLLCWGSEERVARGLAPLTNLAALYRLVHELDPEHPLVLGDTKDAVQKFEHDRSDFFPDACMDVGIWWWYPIPLHAPDANGLDGRERPAGQLTPPSWLTTTLSKKPLWIAIQSYQQPRREAPFPTPAQYRCMAYLSIINGVKGLWFYTGSGQRDWQGRPAGLLNKPEEAHWDYVKQLVTELREFSPVIMAPCGTAKLTLAPAEAPVEFALREWEGKLYLIAANKSDRAQSVRFTGSALQGKHVQVLYETHPAALQEDTLPADFGPFGVHLYRLD